MGILRRRRLQPMQVSLRRFGATTSSAHNTTPTSRAALELAEHMVEPFCLVDVVPWRRALRRGRGGFELCASVPSH